MRRHGQLLANSTGLFWLNGSVQPKEKNFLSCTRMSLRFAVWAAMPIIRVAFQMLTLEQMKTFPQVDGHCTVLSGVGGWSPSHNVTETVG